MSGLLSKNLMWLVLGQPSNLLFQVLKDVASDALLGIGIHAFEELILFLKVALEGVFVLPRQFAQGERTVFSVCFGDHGECGSDKSNHVGKLGSVKDFKLLIRHNLTGN